MSISISNISTQQKPAFKGGVSINLNKISQDFEEKFEKNAVKLQKENPNEISIYGSPLTTEKQYMGVFFSPKAKKQEEKFIDKMENSSIKYYPNISQNKFIDKLS